MEKKKKNRLIIILIIILLLLVSLTVLIIIMRTNEDSWLCRRGTWVKQGNPSEPMPTTVCIDKSSKYYFDDSSLYGEIRVFSPQPDEVITSPVEITGEARGFWFFEGSFPVELTKDNGVSLATGTVTAQGDWMTEEFVPFTATLRFDDVDRKAGKLIFQNANPSGLPENQEKFIVPVKFDQPDATEPAEEKITVKVFFSNSNLDPTASCNKTFSVERQVKTLGVARAALEELLKGPLDLEKTDGYGSSINDKVKINSIRIEHKTVYVDFDSQLEYQVGGSCRISMIHAQIDQTLKQFESIDKVVISIDGRTEDILQP